MEWGSVGGVCAWRSASFIVSASASGTPGSFSPWEIVESVTRRAVTPKPNNVTHKVPCVNGSQFQDIYLGNRLVRSLPSYHPLGCLLSVFPVGRRSFLVCFILCLDLRSTVHGPWSAGTSIGSGKAMESTKRWIMCVFHFASAAWTSSDALGYPP